MGSFLMLMWKPLLACLILTGIHTYLGVHVVERKVIFVDLALAQIAALGASLALLLGFGEHSLTLYFISLFSTFLAAGLFALELPAIRRLVRPLYIQRGILPAAPPASDGT